MPMVYYTEDGRQISEEEAMKLGNYRVFRDEAAAVAAFDRDTATAQANAERDYKNTTGPLAQFASTIVQGGRPAPSDDKQMKRLKLQDQLSKGQITPFEFRKAMDDLDNPASEMDW